MAYGPYFFVILLISFAMISVASSQETRWYLLFPRFCGFLSPSGFQSHLLSGYLDSIGEK